MVLLLTTVTAPPEPPEPPTPPMLTPALTAGEELTAPCRLRVLPPAPPPPPMLWARVAEAKSPMVVMELPREVTLTVPPLPPPPPEPPMLTPAFTEGPEPPASWPLRVPPPLPPPPPTLWAKIP